MNDAGDTGDNRVAIAEERDRYALMLELFGDIITEIAVITDGDEGLFVGYSSIEFTAPVYAGDFIEATGTVVRIGNTSRTVEFEARKVIASRYDVAASAADVLDQPVVVCRATGTTVIPREHSRKLGKSADAARPEAGRD